MPVERQHVEGDEAHLRRPAHRHGGHQRGQAVEARRPAAAGDQLAVENAAPGHDVGERLQAGKRGRDVPARPAVDRHPRRSHVHEGAPPVDLDVIGPGIAFWRTPCGGQHGLEAGGMHSNPSRTPDRPSVSHAGLQISAQPSDHSDGCPPVSGRPSRPTPGGQHWHGAPPEQPGAPHCSELSSRHNRPATKRNSCARHPVPRTPMRPPPHRTTPHGHAPPPISDPPTRPRPRRA